MNILRVLLITLITNLLLSLNSNAQDEDRHKLRTIVIDPGHGGNAPGAVWGTVKEKDITLSVSLKLGAMIKKYFPTVNVVYTRQTDVSVDLSKRSEIANKCNADLFISIHVNASKSTTARGTETYVMGFDKSQANLDIAMKENSVISYENDYESKYEGFDPNSPESYIMFSLIQYSYLEQSTSYASYIQQNFASELPIPNRGVKQAAFLVLWKTTMPSVLTEIGFLSNIEDRKILTTQQGQLNIAKALFNAFLNYKRSFEIGNGQKISTSIAKNVEPKPETIPEKPKTTTQQTQKQSIKSNTNTKENNITFMVQIKSTTRKISITSFNFGKYKSKVIEKNIDNRYKYFIGSVKSYKEALSLQREIRADSFRDAFVVAFNNGTIIPLKEALELISKK